MKNTENTFTGVKFNKQVGSKKVFVGCDTKIKIDLTQGNIYELTLTDNVTSLDVFNLQDGSTYIFIIKQDSTGSRTVTFSSTFLWEGGTAPTITATASAVDVISAICDGDTLLCSYVQDIQ